MRIIIARYKIPFLISLMVALAVVALSAESYWLNAVFAFVGAIIGALIFDIDFFLYTLFIDPADNHSVKLREQKGIGGYISYISENEYKFEDLVFRSILFQIALIVMTIYVLTTDAFLLVQTFMVALYGNLVYSQIIEYQKTKSLRRWFWLHDNELSKNTYLGCIIISLVIFVLFFRFI